MTLTQTIRRAIRPLALIAVAAAVAPVALAGGERKNMAPFAAHAQNPVTRQFGMGEAKNQWPFTRPIGNHRLASATRRATAPIVRGEPKNTAPFTNRVS
jgi:hypothetical protein